MINIRIKPLSVNAVRQGKRFKTPVYRSYEKNMLILLPTLKNFERPEKIGIKFVFQFSNKLQDIDGPIKPLIDILQKKYGWNDNRIYNLVLEKEIVSKGNEGISIEFYQVI